MVQTCSIGVGGVKYSHFTCIYLAKLYEKLLTGGQSCFTLPISKLEQIKVGFHLLNYSQTSYLGISWSIN